LVGIKDTEFRRIQEQPRPGGVGGAIVGAVGKAGRDTDQSTPGDLRGEAGVGRGGEHLAGGEGGVRAAAARRTPISR